MPNKKYAVVFVKEGNPLWASGLFFTKLEWAKEYMEYMNTESRSKDFEVREIELKMVVH